MHVSGILPSLKKSDSSHINNLRVNKIKWCALRENLWEAS